MAFTETHDETKPAGSRARSLGDDDIREAKRVTRERLSVDHDFRSDESGAEETVTPMGTTIGYHKKVTLVQRASHPTVVTDAGIIFSKDVSDIAELHYKDEMANTTQITSGGRINATTLGGVYRVEDVAALANVLPYIYPVGCIYTTTVATNPNTIFGFGTWTAFGAGRVLVGKAAAGTFSTAGATGGEETHTLTAGEMPAHTHTLDVEATGGGATTSVLGTTSASVTARATSSAGTGGAHNNLQPYIVVYLWQRTA